MFTITFTHNGIKYREVCEWTGKGGAQEKAKQLRKFLKDVKVVNVLLARGLPTVA